MDYSGEPFPGARNSWGTLTPSAHHTFPRAQCCMLCQGFRKILQLAPEQQVVRELHQELPRRKRNSVEVEGCNHFPALDNNRVFSRFCSSLSDNQNHSDCNSHWRYYAYPLYSHLETRARDPSGVTVAADLLCYSR